MKRYNIFMLNQVTDTEIILDIVQTYRSTLTNPYTPLAERVLRIEKDLIMTVKKEKSYE